jgi:hypothetical protein
MHKEYVFKTSQIDKIADHLERVRDYYNRDLVAALSNGNPPDSYEVQSLDALIEDVDKVLYFLTDI